MKLKISRKAFAKWLRQNPRLEFDRDMTDACPIAIYLGGGCDREVDVHGKITTVDGRDYDTPKWAHEFAALFDLSVGKPNARLALSLLQPR